MPTVLSESSTFTVSVVVPANGDARTSASVNNAFQALTNRTKKLRDWLMLIDANEDGSADCKLRPPAGKADASSAPILLTKGTNNTKAEAGALEYDGANLYFTPVATRKTVSFSDHTHAVAATPFCSMLYVNDSVSESFTTTDFVDSTLLTLSLPTAAMPLASTDYVVEINSNLRTYAVDGAGARFTAAKTIASTVSELPGSERSVFSSSTTYTLNIPINTMFEANSNDIPITVSIQGKVGATGTLTMTEGSNFIVKVTQGTAAVTGKGSVS